MKVSHGWSWWRLSHKGSLDFLSLICFLAFLHVWQLIFVTSTYSYGIMRKQLDPSYVNHLNMVEVFNIFILELTHWRFVWKDMWKDTKSSGMYMYYKIMAVWNWTLGAISLSLETSWGLHKCRTIKLSYSRILRFPKLTAIVD